MDHRANRRSDDIGMLAHVEVPDAGGQLSLSGFERVFDFIIKEGGILKKTDLCHIC